MADICRTFVSTELPILDQFEDYHDIEFYADRLKKLFGHKIGCAEIGFCEDGQYWGIFYVGRKPNKAAIKQMMAEAKFTPAYDDEE